jgi:hypothetical protein
MSAVSEVAYSSDLSYRAAQSGGPAHSPDINALIMARLIIMITYFLLDKRYSGFVG